MEKWPYQTQDWKDWLRYKRTNGDPPLPEKPEWQNWWPPTRQIDVPEIRGHSRSNR